MVNGVNVTLEQLIRLRAAARGLELGSRHLAISSQAGGYRSAYRGRGLEFDEVRAYQTTDDARTIDWRVTARRGRPHTKIFREERERPVLVLVDLHPGMYFGSRLRFKSVLASQAAALIAWAAEQSGDRIGGVVSGTDDHSELPPKARRAGALAILQALVRQQPEGFGELQPGRLDQALGRLTRVTHPGSLVLILSDFLEAGDSAEKHLTKLTGHNDVMVIFIHDPLESAPPPTGRYRMGTPARQFTLDAAQHSTVTEWQERFQLQFDLVHGICRRHGLHMIELSTGQDPLGSLKIGFARRGKR